MNIIFGGIKKMMYLCRLKQYTSIMALHNIVGRRGEDIAASFLQEKGYTILERNWKRGDLEIDIIAKEGNTIVFVEVKTRSSNLFGNPEDSVDELRKKRLTAASNMYLNYKKLDNPYRYDIIAIILNSAKTEINHIEEAFRPRARFIGPNSMRPEKNWTKSYWKWKRK